MCRGVKPVHNGVWLDGWLSLLLISLVTVAGCCNQNGATTGASEDSTPPSPYVRVSTNDPGVVELQIAVRQFVPSRGKGPPIWLTGVSHIGDSNYYATLQKHLDAQSLVLFEGISGSEPPPPTTGNKRARMAGSAAPDNKGSSTDRSSFQTSLATSLGLVFQLEAIDYVRSNFRNSDLTIPELRQLLATYQAAPGEKAAGDRFEGVLQLMEGGSFLDSLIQVGLRFLSISPKLQALGRLVLIDVIGDIQGDLAQLQGLPPDMKQLLEVLLQRRNEKVVDDLKAELHGLNRHGSVAVFYGTGHMPDLERRLRHDLKYRPAKQLWLTAFAVNPAKAGVSDSERQFLHTLIRQQLGQLRSR